MFNWTSARKVMLRLSTLEEAWNWGTRKRGSEMENSIGKLLTNVQKERERLIQMAVLRHSDGHLSHAMHTHRSFLFSPYVSAFHLSIYTSQLSAFTLSSWLRIHSFTDSNYSNYRNLYYRISFSKNGEKVLFHSWIAVPKTLEISWVRFFLYKKIISEKFILYKNYLPIVFSHTSKFFSNCIIFNTW